MLFINGHNFLAHHRLWKQPKVVSTIEVIPYDDILLVNRKTQKVRRPHFYESLTKIYIIFSALTTNRGAR